PSERFDAAVWVYHFSIVSAIFGILSSPYNALVIAYERMNVFAYISILEAVLKLAIVFILLLFDVDKLILYSGLCLAVFASIRMIYTIYCKKNFVETRYEWKIDRGLLKNLSTYISWDLIGSLATTMAIQGVNIVLNIFFGPVVNAARTISVQVQGLVQMFAGNFQSAVMPQIIKTYAQGDLAYMHSLIYRSCKLTFVLMFVMILPLLFESHYVLDIWLGEYPQYTIEFVELSLLIALIDAMATPFMIAARATGNIKLYSIVTGGLTLLLVPISYVLLRLGFNPTSVLVVHVSISSICFFARLLIVNPLIQFSIRDYVQKVLTKTVMVVVFSFPVILSLHYVEMNKHLMFLSTVFVSVLLVSFFSYMFLLDSSEKNFVSNMLKNR
ncbi:MAG: lipopolysaccharide biosynthesis protein, partial [Bacteroidales bacterium]|nr:lipopolysaccharide biosynthesis protein [Bacteroidales bacterium]